MSDSTCLAHWVVYLSKGIEDYAHCSHCNCFWDWGTICEVGMHYCPNCGAKMEEGVVEHR